MTIQWPPIPCHVRRCRRNATHAVSGERASAGACSDHIQAVKDWCGPGPHRVRRLPDADTEAEQPKLFDDPNGDAAA